MPEVVILVVQVEVEHIIIVVDLVVDQQLLDKEMQELVVSVGQTILVVEEEVQVIVHLLVEVVVLLTVVVVFKYQQHLEIQYRHQLQRVVV